MAAHKFSYGARAQWWMKLDHDATLALVTNSPFGSAYALLHDTGALMHDERGPIVAASWSDICEYARVNSALWVLALHDRRVIRLAFGKNGAYVDTNSVLLVCDEDALLTLTQETTHEEAKPSNKTRHLSGAEKRRRARERSS